jgi:predicted TPR repeat methyltransferase
MTSERDVVPDTVTRALAVESFPRASTYDPAWILENQMGPNVPWLTEYLTQSLDLRPTMRVLDLGCGKSTEDRLTSGP